MPSAVRPSSRSSCLSGSLSSPSLFAYPGYIGGLTYAEVVANKIHSRVYWRSSVQFPNKIGTSPLHIPSIEAAAVDKPISFIRPELTKYEDLAKELSVNNCTAKVEAIVVVSLESWNLQMIE